MSKYAFTYEEVNLMRQWYNHIQDTAHPEYLKAADVALGERLIQHCRNKRRPIISLKDRPEALYRWRRVTRVPKLGEKQNVTFIWFRCYDSPSGKPACQVLEGMGISRDTTDKPALAIHLKPRYFKSEKERDGFIQREKDYWGCK